MKFCVKLLAIVLVLVTFSTQVASCAFPSFNIGTTDKNTSTDNVVVIPPNNGENGENSGNHVGGAVVENVTAPYIADVYVSAPVEPDESNRVPEGGVNLDSSLANAIVPGGVKLEDGSNEVALTINGIEDSEANVELLESEVSSSFDVHVSGVALDNIVPMEVKLTAAAVKGLNSTSIKLYHVENGETIEMTLIPNDAEFTAHNQFKYDPATGDVTLYIASFSEFAIVANTDNAWTGGVDHSWYKADATELVIANAEQLWSLSQIVGGMNGQTPDSFAGKTIKLIADINLGDKESENNPDIIFYPIGYYNSEGTYERTNTAITSGLRNFEGTFDGNGHTIANFYQNTWEMKGDHNWYSPEEQYYRDGMGLFGRVYGGTVKNLTVENFSSDGEITTTGVIAAYADGATFQNISIFNCNPRVYNIGNGGIVGCVGWYAKEAGLKTYFTNITVDNTNKISALWGSYDVACGGILGQYYPTSGQSSYNYPVNAGIEFTNCHVSAVMDVYNDVCANYQYYAYRYTGMLIGSVRENETIDGRVYPKMDGIVANGCTVHFGDWNDYYYCELVANTTASYTHDHQMSRLTQVAAVNGTTITPLKGEPFTVPAEGRYNYVVVTGEHASENATCYHFVDGAVWNHEDAGYHNGENGEKFIDENGDGEPDLKEDKQHIYLEFNNLFTGYGWGVTSVGLDTYENVNVKDKLANIGIGPGEAEGSTEKFDYIYTGNEGKLEIGKEYTLGELFAATGLGEAIKNSNVVVTVSPSSANAKVDYLYTMNTEGWTQSTLKISTPGDVTITITDYYYCKSTSITVNVDKAHKFEYLYGKERNGETNLNHKDFLLRVGNANAVSLNLLFGEIENCYLVDLSTLNVTVTNGTFTKGNTWDTSTINFAGYTGIATITIEDGTSYPCGIKVEVVNGTNTTSATSATSGNIVLLGDAGLSSLTVSGRYAFYGNGFTLTYSGNGAYLNNGLKQGVVTVSGNGTLDNVRIVAPIYPNAYMYYGSTSLGTAVKDGPSSVEGDKTRYHYQLSAVALSENGTVSNCYIYGGRNNIFVNTGDVTIKDTILECGTVANVQIQSNSSHTITLENVTTIQYKVNATIVDTSKVMLGAGILVGPETNDNPTIVLNGDLKQYNWVTSEDESSVSDEAAQKIINAAINATEYNHTVNGKTSSNLGIIYMNDHTATIDDNTELPYALGTITISGVTGKVYSLQNATEEQIYSDYGNADRSTVNGIYVPQFSYSSDLGGQYEAKTDNGDNFLYREGDTIYVMFPAGDTKEVNLATLVNISKYTGKSMNLEFTCVNSKGEKQTITDNKVTLSAADTYTITYTLEDTWFYDKNGEEIDKSITYSWNVTLSVSLKDIASPNAKFEFNTDSQKMGYYVKSSIFSTSVYQYIPFLAGLKIYDYIGQAEYLRFDGDTDFNKVASVTITGYTSNEAYIEVKLTDGGVINTKFLARADSGGGSTYTGSIKTSGGKIYFVNDGTTSESAGTTTSAYWYVDYYRFIGNNGVTITSSQQTFNSAGSSVSTPSANFSTIINYTVSYDANGGTCGQTTGYATSVAAAVTLPAPARSGYVFKGWYTAATDGERVGGTSDSYTPSSDITLYAQWTAPFDVTYNANGGSCGTSSEKYTGTALILPTPENGDKNFDGWFTATEGGTRVGGAGDSYTPTEAITLYAQWSYNVTVNYNANGGSCDTSSASVNKGESVTLPIPSREHYTFNGWYTASSGGTLIGAAGTTCTPEANVTLYAQWTPNSYTVTYNANSGSVSPSSATVAYGNSVTLPTPTRSNYTFNGWYTASSGGTLIGGAGASYSPEANITLYAQWTKDSGCVTGDTLITLADGTQKRIDAVTTDDMLLVWNHFTGNYEAVPAAIIFNHGFDNNTVIKLNFSDGTQVKMVNLHQFFDADLNKYVSIDATTVADYVGHNFVKQSGDSYTTVTLDSFEISEEYIEAYGIISALHYNILVEGMFSTDFMLEDYDLFNYFAFGEGMMFDAELMQNDIEKYGLYTYEDFADYLTYEQFVAFNVQYFKISVAKGHYTYEGILDLISEYLNK